MKKTHFVLLLSIAIAGMLASYRVQHHAELRITENQSLIRRQNNQLSKAETELQRLSNFLTAQQNEQIPGDLEAELVRLRVEAEALRNQTNELEKRRAENSQLRNSNSASSPGLLRKDYDALFSTAIESKFKDPTNPSKHLEELNRRERRKWWDVRNISMGLYHYAREHNGEYPTDIETAKPYIWNNAEKSPAIEPFELVYQGSVDELSNIPSHDIALIRERQPWVSTSGKWARFYGMVGGSTRIVESDDNFQSWEAEHIIPPR